MEKLHLPKGLVPENKEKLDKKTKELQKKQEKKSDQKQQLFFNNVIYEDLTLEDLKKTKPIKDNLIHVLIEFSNRNIKYESFFFPKDTEGRSVIYLEQTDPEEEEDDLKAVIDIIKDHYPRLQTRFQGKYDLWLIMPNHKVLDMGTIIHDIQDFFMHVFEDVKIRQVKFENVRKANLSQLGISKAKLVYNK